MTSCQSPRKVLVTAHRLGKASLPEYASRFSRRDFTLPQLFACPVLRQFYNLSCRRAEAMPADSPSWRRAIGLKRTPDHNTLCDAFGLPTRGPAVRAMLDGTARAFGEAGLLGLDDKPPAVDSTAFEGRHVGRHFEKRKERSSSERAAKARRSATVRSLPKLAIGVACGRHPILPAWATTGLGADHPHFETVVFDARRRADVRAVVADAGHDSERAHRPARQDMGLDCLIPPRAGRPTGKAPPTPYRAGMAELFAAEASPGACGRRWQVGTANSRMKRNYGSSLRAATAPRREREMMLKVLTHNVAL